MSKCGFLIVKNKVNIVKLAGSLIFFCVGVAARKEAGGRHIYGAEGQAGSQNER